MRKIDENFQKQGWINIFANFNLLRLERKLGNYKNKANKLTPSQSLFILLHVRNTFGDMHMWKSNNRKLKPTINNRITKKNLLIIFLIIVTFPFITIKKSFATEETLEQKQKKIEMLGSELEEACKNYGKIRVSILSKQLISYGELSMPIFTKLLWTEKGLGESVGAWGLGEIKSEKAVDTLIKKFKDKEKNGNFGSLDAIKALGKIGGDKAEKFLENLLNKTNGIEINTAFIILSNKYNKKAEDVLIESIERHKSIQTILDLPILFKTRKEDIIKGAISILEDSRMSEWNRIDEISAATDVLIKAEYITADDVLIKAFDIQKNELARSFIVERIGKLKSNKAINFLSILENKSDKELSPFLKSKIKGIKGK